MNIQEDSQRKWRNKLRSRRGTPQGESVNQVVYFGKWCEGSQVDISHSTSPNVAISSTTSLRKRT